MSIDTQLLPPTSDSANRQDLPNLLVPPAMLVASAAMGIASHLHLGLSGEIAAAVGISLFCLMLMCHVLLRAADEADRAADEAAERGIEQVSSPMPVVLAEQTEQQLPTPSVARSGEAAEALRRPAGETRPTASTDAYVRLESSTGEPPAWSFRPVDLRYDTQVPDVVPAKPESPRPQVLPDLGLLRPTIAEDRQPYVLTPVEAQLQVDREADRIDSILKRLAAQIHAGVGTVPTETAPLAASTAAASADELLAQLAAAHPDAALASAVDALRSTVEAMRRCPDAPGQAPTRGAGDAKPAPTATASQTELRVAAVAEALRAERADVFLAPILGLAGEQARHFEVSVHLRTPEGEVLDARTTAGAASLLPLLDALNVRHSAGFAMMLERRAREGSVFSRVTGQSLENEQFVNDVAGRHAQGIAERMVLAFAQEELRGLGPAQLSALGDLGRLGFRFAIQGVADLDMDFDSLKALGFEFVKLEAAVFLGGLRCNGAHIPASDICRHFEDLGLEVIVSDIDNATVRDRMLGCGVVYGQGPLFGKPRPVHVVGMMDGSMAA